MYLMQTVSAVPRPRTASHVEARPPYLSPSQGDYLTNKNHLIENGFASHARIHGTRGRNDSERKPQIESAAHGNEEEKKKEKKWTLGGLFRRNRKKDADDSSEDSDEDGKKGFLYRRKSKRRKVKVRSAANGFDVVIPQQKEKGSGVGLTAEQLWSEESKPPESGPVRFIHRHQNEVSNSLQVPRHGRRDSKSSGGSENVEIRKSRKEVMARAEAKRDMLRDESSSDEQESYHSNSSLAERKPRRSDRHKRLSRDDDARMIKSDFEGHRLGSQRSSRPGPDSSDHINLINHSGTPSPSRSPRVRQKQLLRYMESYPRDSYPTSTFPPGAHHPAPHAKETQACLAFGTRSQAHRGSRGSDCIQNLPRSVSSIENSNRRTLMEYEQFLSSCGSGREKSLSCDQGIHRASYFQSDPLPKNNSDSRRQTHGEREVYNARVPPNGMGVVENRTESLSVQPGMFPHQPTQIVQRSSSGILFQNFNTNRSHSYQHIPSGQFRTNQAYRPPAEGKRTSNVYYWSQDESNAKEIIYGNLPANKNAEGVKPANASVLRYYADQNPRSRNPIHITCNSISDYLSDSAVPQPVQNRSAKASDFWKLKDQELMKNKKADGSSSLKPPFTQGPKLDRSRSNSPRLNKSVHEKLTVTDGNAICSSKKSKSLKEEYNVAKVSKTPPEPPVRRLPKQEVLARLQKCEQLKNKQHETKISNSNLDEALNELEIIYNSLRLKDEDLVDRAERRDLPVYRPSKKESGVPSARDKAQYFYEGTDFSFNLPQNSEHRRALPLRRSGIPDKTADDMAFRRLNTRDRTDPKKLPPQSYLRSSPALSPIPPVSPTFPKDSNEPDVTYDDVVFRNIRHANSTLKIADPQPPFGIPIGVIAPAPNSDYLHATPKERFRPTFTSTKTPDVVKDDLAFRNLRKDNKINEGNDSSVLLKKRAVRSLSANLYNIMQKNSEIVFPETNNNVICEKNCEKTRSLTDLSRANSALEKRLKELKEEKNAKRAEFFELSKELRKNGGETVNWTELANLNKNFEADKRAQGDSKAFRSPVVELSRYPAAAPSSSLKANPFKENLPGAIDEDQLESLLSAIAIEAKNASKDLERQLGQLEAKEPPKFPAVEVSDVKFQTNPLDRSKRRRNLSLSSSVEGMEEMPKTASLERRRARKCSSSSAKSAGLFQATQVLRRAEKTGSGNAKPELEKERRPVESDSLCGPGLGEPKQSQIFQLVTDLSQILHDVEVQQHLNEEMATETVKALKNDSNDVFQEVYEYNCRLSRRESLRNEEEASAESAGERKQETRAEEEAVSDIEKEFEKLHQEAGAKEGGGESRLVEDLMADLTSVNQSPSDPHSSFPFPNEERSTPSEGPLGRDKDGTSPGSSKGEGDSPNVGWRGNDGKIQADEGEEVTMDKLPADAKGERAGAPSRSSSDAEQKRERIESYKDARRRELSAKYGPRQETTRLFKAARKTEDPREGGTCGPFLKSYLDSQHLETHVPSTERRRPRLRREGNKTDEASGTEDPGRRDAVLVRETKASRLRAATRAPSSDAAAASPLPKSSRDAKKTENEKSPASASPTRGGRDVDKSLSRKSHLNRSHTSEGVYDDVCVPGGSNIRRRGVKTWSSESPPANKALSTRASMGNANGGLKEASSERGAPSALRTSFSLRKKSGSLSPPKSSPLGKKESGVGKKGAAENGDLQSPVRRFSVDKTKVDVATRAEILAASTLKMIDRLDEINRARRSQEGRARDDDSSFKKPLPFNSVIKAKVPVQDDNTAKSSPNRKTSRATKMESPKKSPARGNSFAKPSILKASVPATDGKPVSILKRKPLSQDDAQSSSPPVTFSPSVLKKEGDPKRQGILKKRRSLDENEVMRRRSYSPDASYSDFKSILKTQRRSSMEELTRRSHSPDSAPQGILKQKIGREEDVEDAAASWSEPQGILKRKSLSCLTASHQHKADAAAVTEENVRPILKKKSSSEDHSASDLSLTEVPKSILKKKTSLDAEEGEEKPKKPILKTARISSFDEPEETKRGVDAEPKPILKRENSRTKLEEGEDPVVLRPKTRRPDRPYSSPDIGNELGAIFLKRRSLEFQPVSVEWEGWRTRKASSNDRLRGDADRRPLSVAEKISNLENFLELERLERERRNSVPGTPPQSPPDSPVTEGFPWRPGTNVPPPPSSSSFTSEGRTLPKSRSGSDEESVGEVPSLKCCCDDADRDADPCPFPQKPRASARGRKPRSEDAEATGQQFDRNSLHSTDSEPAVHGDSGRKAEDKNDAESFFSLEERISSLSLEEEPFESCSQLMERNEGEDAFLLQKSGSVSAKTSLFKELEKKLKVEGEKVRRVPKGGNEGVNRRQEKKLLGEADVLRYNTQPVSSEEVELAARKNRNAGDEDQGREAENHEDELSAMSYLDRLRLFESTLAPRFPDPAIRKRPARFHTQPVTTVEVETAKSQRLPPSAAKAPDQQPTGPGTPFPKTVTDISEPGRDLLKSFQSKTGEEKNKPKGILKNLNQSSEVKEARRPPPSDSDSSDSEKKGILKSELSESFRNLKKALRSAEREVAAGKPKGILKTPSAEKRATSSSEEEERGQKTGANLAAILQKVEPIVWDGLRRKAKGAGADIGRSTERSKHLRNRNNSSIVKSQSHSSVSSVHRPRVVDAEPESSSGWRRVDAGVGEGCLLRDETDDGMGGLRRSTTQPLAPADGGTEDDMSGASIRERLARLKRSGELDWQKRKSLVTNLDGELSAITSGNYLFNENCLLRDRNRPMSPQGFNEKPGEESRSSILADRLGRLDAAKDGWKKRVKPSDAARFSVEGKMLEKLESQSPPNLTVQISPSRTPPAERKKRSPKAVRFRSKRGNLSLSSVPSSPMENINNPIARSVSAPGSGKDGLFSLSVCEGSNGPIVSVPKNDDETFTSFFGNLLTERAVEEHLDIKDEDLDVVTRMKSSQLLVQKKTTKTHKRRATVKNPVKALAARLELQEYTEVKTGIAEKELKRMKIEKASKNSNLAIEALAGLASQEDFTAVNLKKASEGGPSSPDAPYKDLMLLQVKGRRHVQTRLVQPAADNVNAGDCFVLVASDKLFLYAGELANVIERARAAEIASHIQQKGDLGCSSESVIVVGEGGRATEAQVRAFWSLLGGEPGCEREAGNVDEDELFESALVDTNMVYEVVNDELVPNETYWGSIPKIEVLDPNKVLVFDFGSEFYVWNGKNVSLSQRKVALKLGRELWEEGFDYAECDVCPLTAAGRLGGSRGPWDEVPDSEKAGPVRPTWALFAKITQNMETVLFREKFLDWPDYSRVIRRTKKGEGNELGDPSAGLELKPCDAKKMKENVVPEPDLVLEGNHLGRGVRYFDEETRRCSEIATQGVTVWHVKEYEYSEIPSASAGQFHMEGSYVVRWHYVITITGRELSGQPSKHLTTGRNRYAYFFWQGRDSPVSDKGAAACLTVELDKEHGPQVRVVQGSEPPAFLNLFRGKMVVHLGSRDSRAGGLRLFICRGETSSEAALVEVPCSMRQLRSAASFVLVDNRRGKLFIWHGWKSLRGTRKVAVRAAEQIQAEAPEEFQFQTREILVKEELEGEESQELIKALGGDNRQLYFSLLEDRASEVITPRLFHLTSVSGEFLFAEVASPQLSEDAMTPFPFLQSDLYSASQPALFLLDAGSSLWLWQGWWEESSESDRGSGYLRFQAERRAAMRTAISYWSLARGTTAPKAFLIWAGLEPLAFTNLFPFWSDRDDVAEINMKDGRKPGEAVPVKTELASLTQSTYPLAQLQNRPLPLGVNPTSLEDYLEPQCFPELFGVEKEEFLAMPSWKKKKLKQEAGLF